jgi:RHS repeat-associated protein
VATDSRGRWDTNTVTAYLPATVTFAYDLNGNLRTNGTRLLDYDDENQLIRITEPGAWLSEFVYDGKMRRRLRREYVWQSAIWNLQSEIQYVYDGNLVIQERHYTPHFSTSHPQQTVTYTRGRDLSGTLEGAGGIGGLLSRTASEISNLQSPSHAYYHADGNGNITCLVATNQAVVARYLYDPYGNQLAATGPLAEANLYRFSSKEWHPPSGLVYYLYRYYDPSLQRWPNRDPIEEEGGLNVYAFVSGDPINKIDKFGLASSTTPGVPHVSNDRHNNYLIFYATCPAGWSVTAVSVTYDSEGMANGMLTAGASDERRQWLLDYNYGGLKSVGRSSCRGEPVEVQAYMRTRLVSPGWRFAAWRAANGLPGADDILALYQANTQIHWLCNNCCGRGTSTR